MSVENSFFETALYQVTGKNHKIIRATPLSGGDINRAVWLHTNQGSFFLKYNSPSVGDLFEKEAHGLRLLSKTETLRVPAILGSGSTEEYSFLILEYLNPEPQDTDFWEQFGESLAKLHRHSHEYFGLDRDNHIGRLPQINTPTSDWVDFFIEQRLAVQISMAIQNAHISADLAQKLEKLYPRLSEILPQEPPALLHGDLWSGNFMCGPSSDPCIFDPAVYYGHREMELAFTQLFGGFNTRFYQSYELNFPLSPGFSERKDLYNLYPLLVHVNLFGPSYLAGINQTLSRFI